jgi:hypothetical protein
MENMRHAWLVVRTVPVLITMWVQGPPTFPVARTHEHREVRHGGTVVDPYFWLREKTILRLSGISKAKTPTRRR